MRFADEHESVHCDEHDREGGEVHGGALGQPHQRTHHRLGKSILVFQYFFSVGVPILKYLIYESEASLWSLS